MQISKIINLFKCPKYMINDMLARASHGCVCVKYVKQDYYCNDFAKFRVLQFSALILQLSLNNLFLKSSLDAHQMMK